MPKILGININFAIFFNWALCECFAKLMLSPNNFKKIWEKFLFFRNSDEISANTFENCDIFVIPGPRAKFYAHEVINKLIVNLNNIFFSLKPSMRSLKEEGIFWLPQVKVESRRMTPI